MNVGVFFILLFGHSYSIKLDVFELLDSVSDSIDYFLFNYKSWNQDLRFTLNIIESQTSRILDGYVKSELDFDLLYVPVLRRFNGQSQLLSEKLKPHILNDKIPKELPFHHLIFDSKWKTHLLYPHRISDKTMLWHNKEPKSFEAHIAQLNDYYVCILNLLTPDICQKNSIFNIEKYGNCIKIMSQPPLYHLPEIQFPLDIVNVQLLYSILVVKIGCGDIFEKELGNRGINLFNWQAELCTNSHYHWSKANQAGLNSTLLQTEYSCLLLGFVDFSSKTRLAELISHFPASSSYETSGCISIPSEEAFNPIWNGDGGNTAYSPFSHPFAYDFSFPLSYHYPFKPQASPILPVNNNVEIQHSSAKVCHPLMTNFVTRILIMYVRFILDPGPTKFKAYWVEPDMYEEKTLNAIKYQPEAKPLLAIEEDERSLDPGKEVVDNGERSREQSVQDLKVEGVKFGPENVGRMGADKLLLPTQDPNVEREGGAGYYVESLINNPVPQESQVDQHKSALEPLPMTDEDISYFSASYLVIYVVVICAATCLLYRHYRRSKWKYRGLASMFTFPKKIHFSKYSQRRSSSHNY